MYNLQCILCALGPRNNNNTGSSKYGRQRLVHRCSQT